MTTMFDAPMQDFSADSTMDADMLPSSTSDADWLQVENMMEDGDFSRPLGDEVDMIHGDVQEFEMRDVGEVETEDLDQMLPEPVGQHTRAEPQDQEIPDASRAPTPSTQIPFSQSKAFSALTSPESPSQKSHTKLTSNPETMDSVQQDPITSQGFKGLDTEFKATQAAMHSAQPDPTTSQGFEGLDSKLKASPKATGSAIFHGYEGLDESSIPPPDPPEEQSLISHAGVDGAILDNHDALILSGESTRSPHPQLQAQLLESPDHGDTPELSPDPAHVVHKEHPQEAQSFPESEESSQSGVHLAHQLGEHVEDQVTQEEEDGPLIDPPPSVLLSYPFDGSRFTLFNLPEDPQHAFFDTGITNPSTGHDEAHEAHAKPTPSLTENLVAPEAPILLFRERFSLYYEPLSDVFEALRSDEAINTGGRFDHNIELVISAPELDLTLPEDNVNAREVSLHDLGVLHTGCDLSGPLTLRLDTISPRFGTRYKAIRDEIVRVVSQQEEDEQRSQLESTKVLYTDNTLLHDSPDDQVQHEAPEKFSSDHNHPDLVEDTGGKHKQSSESEAGVGDNVSHEHGSDSHHRDEGDEDGDADADADADVDAEGYEDAESGEYVEYERYEDETGDVAEESYEGAEDEYAEEGQGAEAGYEVDEAPYTHREEEELHTDCPDGTEPFLEDEHKSLAPQDANDPETTGEVFNHASEYLGHSGNKNPSAEDAPEEYESTPSTHYRPLENFTNTRMSTSQEVADKLTDTLELESNAHEATSHDFLLSAEHFSSTEHLLSEARAPSRSITPRLSADPTQGQDEVIAYEDTIGDDDDEPDDVSRRSTLRTASGIQGSRVVSTVSKRSYDEHESDQLEGRQDALTATKRLRVD